MVSTVACDALCAPRDVVNPGPGSAARRPGRKRGADAVPRDARCGVGRPLRAMSLAPPRCAWIGRLPWCLHAITAAERVSVASRIGQGGLPGGRVIADLRGNSRSLTTVPCSPLGPERLVRVHGPADVMLGRARVNALAAQISPRSNRTLSGPSCLGLVPVRLLTSLAQVVPAWAPITSASPRRGPGAERLVCAAISILRRRLVSGASKRAPPRLPEARAAPMFISLPYLCSSARSSCDSMTNQARSSRREVEEGQALASTRPGAATLLRQCSMREDGVCWTRASGLTLRPNSPSAHQNRIRVISTSPRSRYCTTRQGMVSQRVPDMPLQRKALPPHGCPSPGM